MAQKTGKEETVPDQIQICSLPIQISTVRSSDHRKISSAALPEKSHVTEEKKVSLKRPREVSRCSGSGCRKRIGLMGFRCRCGDTFCSEHRYSDRHDCDYDYKKAGREAIARENPVVRAAKLVKI